MARVLVFLTSLALAQAAFGVPITSGVYSQTRSPTVAPTNTSSQPGTTGIATTSVVNPATGQIFAAGSVGYQGPSLLPAISAYAYDVDQVGGARETATLSTNWGFQQYTFQQTGTVTLNGTLSYSQSGFVNPAPFTPINGGGINPDRLFAFQMAGNFVETDNCTSITAAGIRQNMGFAGLPTCIINNGGATPSGSTIDFIGLQSSVVSTFNSINGPITNGVATANLSIFGNPGDVWYVGANMRAFGIDGGFGDSRNTLTASFDDPTLLTATGFLQRTFQKAPVSSVSVPEPSTLALFGIGLLGLVRRRKTA